MIEYINDDHCEVVCQSIGKVTLTGYGHGNIYEAKLSTNLSEQQLKKFGIATRNFLI